MKLPRWLLIASLVFGPCLIPAVELNDGNFERWRNRILPAPEEMSYSKIAWRTSFWDAVIEAQKREMPILLWTMNGHPLGCT